MPMFYQSLASFSVRLELHLPDCSHTPLQYPSYFALEVLEMPADFSSSYEQPINQVTPPSRL